MFFILFQDIKEDFAYDYDQLGKKNKDSNVYLNICRVIFSNVKENGKLKNTNYIVKLNERYKFIFRC